MIRVFFRYDDFSQLSPYGVDRGVIDAFARSGFCCTFAVIPAVTAGSFRDAAAKGNHPLAGEKLAMLRQAATAGSVDVALHGLHHRTAHRRPPHSEFAGVTAAEQLARIRQGKRMLEEALGTQIAVFVPPWNTYDKDTLAALSEAGLSAISANRQAVLVEKEAFVYVPITIELPDLRQAVEAARNSDDREAVVGVLMHPYDFHESGDERASVSTGDLSRELEWLRTQPDVQVVPVTELLGSGRFDAERFRANRPSVLEMVYPPGVRKTYDVPLYHSARYARGSRRTKALATAIIFVALAALGFWFSRALLEIATETALASSARMLGWVAGVLLALIIVRAIKAREIYFRPMAAVSVLAGMLLAFSVVSG